MIKILFICHRDKCLTPQMEHFMELMVKYIG